VRFLCIRPRSVEAVIELSLADDLERDPKFVHAASLVAMNSRMPSYGLEQVSSTGRSREKPLLLLAPVFETKKTTALNRRRPYLA